MACDVLVIGGGPVGMLLAIDLAARGVTVTLVEARPAGQLPSVKCNHIASRTMETFRRLGLSRAVRAVGLPDDFPNDIVFRTRMTGKEMARIRIPSRQDRYTATGDRTPTGPRPSRRTGSIRSISNPSCSRAPLPIPASRSCRTAALYRQRRTQTASARPSRASMMAGRSRCRPATWPVAMAAPRRCAN